MDRSASIDCDSSGLYRLIFRIIAALAKGNKAIWQQRIRESGAQFILVLLRWIKKKKNDTRKSVNRDRTWNLSKATWMRENAKRFRHRELILLRSEKEVANEEERGKNTLRARANLGDVGFKLQRFVWGAKRVFLPTGAYSSLVSWCESCREFFLFYLYLAFISVFRLSQVERT